MALNVVAIALAAGFVLVLVVRLPLFVYTAALKEELKRHARRLARLLRVEALAKDAKDDDAAARAKKLIDKENARHEKFMAKFEADNAKGAQK